MIEILEESIGNPISITYFADHGIKRLIKVEYADRVGYYEAENICDALWKAVKATL